MKLVPALYTRLAVKNGAFFLMQFSPHGRVISTKIWVVATPDCQGTKFGGFLEKIIMIERRRSCRPDPGTLQDVERAWPTWHGGPSTIRSKIV